MINLLPQNEKQYIKSEYRYRFIAIVLLFFIALVVISGFLLLPSYITVVYKRNLAEQNIEIAKKTETDNHKKLTEELKNLKNTTVILAPENAVTLPTGVIAAILAHKNSDISITAIEYALTKEGTFTLSLNGLARTRASLAAYAKGIQEEKNITKVNLPVGNLAQEANIKFNLAIEGK